MTGKSQPDWISVKDRLPTKRALDEESTSDNMEGVLLWVKYSRHKESFSSEVSGWVSLGYLNHRGLWVAKDEETLIDSIEGTEVTHWQSLPTPPEAV